MISESSLRLASWVFLLSGSGQFQRDGPNGRTSQARASTPYSSASRMSGAASRSVPVSACQSIAQQFERSALYISIGWPSTHESASLAVRSTAMSVTCASSNSGFQSSSR